MKEVTKKISQYALPLILIFYLLTRLLFLTRLPIFTDESIYIYWSKLIETTHSQWFIALTDGKPPLLTWMIAVFLTILPQHLYLIAGRLPSVIAGLFSVLGMWFISGSLFKSRKAQIIASILYIIHPFTLFYDRMALFDSMLQASLLWSVYFALKSAKSLQTRDVIFWGIALGIAFLSKPTALMFVFLTPVALVMYASTLYKKLPVQKLAVSAVIAIVISEVINNLQRLSHVYYLAAIKNSQFQQPISELLKDPLKLTFGNLQGFYSWILGYYTVPFFLLVIVAFVYCLLKHFRVGAILLGLFLLPIIALATVGREIFPRYILFTTPYALLAVTYFISELLQRKKRFNYSILIASVAFCLPLLLLSSAIIVDPAKAAIPETDYHQYVSEHPSGYGLAKVFAFLDTKKMEHPITIVTQGTFGLYPYAFNLEYWGDPRVTIIPRWPLTTIDQDIISASKKSDTYIILKEGQSVPANLPVTAVLKAEKPGGRYPIFVTQLKQ